jgi:DNA recombination protein RmuC
MGQLKEGQGNLIGQANKLRELGVKAYKNLPETIAEE